MDVELIAIIARSLERLIAVLLGGLCVYYGFRLFVALPTETLSDGKIRLPGMSVVLAKAGPGVFFAAFGALVIVTSLVRSVQVGPNYVGATNSPPVPRDAPVGGHRSGLEQEIVRVQLALQSINCMQRLAGARTKALSSDVDQAAREAKLALLARVWDRKAWGDLDAFEQWVNGTVAATTSPAKIAFEAERGDCPH